MKQGDKEGLDAVVGQKMRLGVAGVTHVVAASAEWLVEVVGLDQSQL